MERKTIELPGIQRAFPDNINIDGALHELINLRNYKKALRPVGQKLKVQDDWVYENQPHYIHKTTDGYEWLISRNTSGDVLQSYSGLAAQTITTISTSKTIRFTSLKNVLLIINETDQEINYAIYDVETNTYNYIGSERFPDILNINITTSGGYTYPEDSQYFETDDVSGDTDRESYAVGLARDIEVQNNKNGYFTGYVSFRYAYELYDGTIIRPSAPVKVKRGVWKWYRDTDPGYDRIRIYVGVENLIYQVLTGNSDITAIKSTYGDLIKSVNIYMTRPVIPYDPDWTNITSAPGEDVSNAVEMDEKNTDDIHEEVLTESSYRLIKKINLDDIEHDATGTSLKTGDINELESKESMPVDNFTFHKIYGECDFRYNSRLWFGDIKTTLYKGFNPDNFVIQDPDGVYSLSSSFDIYFEVEIKDINGTKTVRSDAYSYNQWMFDGNNKIYLHLKTYFAYPDSRATKLRVMIKTGETVDAGSSLSIKTVYKAAEFNLSAHPTMNMAYYIWKDTDSIDEDKDNFSAQALATISNEIYDKNRIQACYVDNPFFFPAENSYRVGSQTVIAMGANTIPVDTGQFGDYPVFAFCEDGVWALNISTSGEILVNSIVPVAGDSCNSKDSVLSTEFGVVFASQEGIFVINGYRPEKLSYILEGDYESVLNGNTDLDDIQTKVSAGDISNLICSSEALTYFSGASVGYDHRRKELTISNTNYNFSLNYNFSSQSWFKSSQVFNRFIYNYPKMYGESGGSLYDLTQEDWSNTTNVNCYLETKPMKFSLDNLKKIDRCVLRGLFDNEGSAELALFGSTDGVNWHLITGSNVMTSKYKDMLLYRSYYSSVQFILVFNAKLKEDSYITHIDVVYRNRFSRKLR